MVKHVSPHISTSSRVHATPLSHNEPTREHIRARIGDLLPAGPYVTDADFARAIDLSLKTLANRRAAKPGSLPEPLRLYGSTAGRHVREDLLDWMVEEEIKARSVVIHRCR